MNFTKPFSLFSKMPTTTWHSFLKYIQSNYTKHILLIKTIQYLKPHYPQFDISKEKLHEHLYPNTTFNNNKLAQVLHRLQSVALDYIGDTANDTVQSQIQTHLYLQNIKADRLAKSALKKLSSLPNEDEILADYQSTHYLAFEATQSILAKGIRTAEPNLQEAHDSLDSAYLLEKLILTCSALNYARLSHQTYQLGIIDQLNVYLSSTITKSQPTHFLFYKIYRFLSGEDRAFEEVAKFLTEIKLSNSDTTSMIYTYCINYCIGKINNSELSYFKTLFVIYKSQIDSDCIYDAQNIISPATLKNILTVAIRNKELKWATDFIKNQEKHLLEIHREVVYNYCLALLQYESQQYKKSIQFILQSKPTDFLDNVSMRVLHIKSLWAMDDLEGIDILLANFKLYLLRHKNKGYHYSFHINFIKSLTKINQMKSHSLKEKKEILAYIDKLDKVAEKKWLIDVMK